MISDVAQNYHIFKEAKEGVDIGLAVLVVPPVEVESKRGGPERNLHQLLFVTDCSPLVPTSRLEPTVWVEVEHCEDHGDHAGAHESDEECLVELKDV